MNNYHELYLELDRIFSALSQADLLSTSCCQDELFLHIINQSNFYITVHDVEFFRPLSINEQMRSFYGFEEQIFRGLDHFYYLRTIHTSTYHSLIESMAFFRKDLPGNLDLTYKLLHASGEWKQTIGTTKTIVRNSRNRPKIALTIMRENTSELPKSVYENFAALTTREREIIGLLIAGLSKKEIADKLFISSGTVVTHTKNIYRKLQVKKITELAHLVDLFDMK
ncbi:helix-turn-helix domain-containing protein [Sphingobacterium suaedae]|uniref:Helix-turn-helix transcriptional regulator n=1 Tax=Sphingobacterium suaedae TaxID=1686402 RepID=A0ABW5KNZ6_9SPHI